MNKLVLNLFKTIRRKKMFNNSRQTNNSGNVNITTNLYTSFSASSKLIVSAWNNQISIKFAPFKGKDANGINQYATDYQEIVSTGLTADNAGALLKGIDDIIIPAINSLKSASISVRMGTDLNKKVLNVAYDSSKDIVSLILMYGINEQNVANANATITYEFPTKSYYVDYDPSTGNAKEVITQAPFKTFIMKIRDVYNLSPVVSHTMKYNDALKSSFSSNNAYQQNNTTAQSYQAPIVNANSFADVLEFN